MHWWHTLQMAEHPPNPNESREYIVSEYKPTAEHQKKSEDKTKPFNEEFALPMDEHSVEERERAQRTGDEHDHETKREHNDQDK